MLSIRGLNNYLALCIRGDHWDNQAINLMALKNGSHSILIQLVG